MTGRESYDAFMWFVAVTWIGSAVAFGAWQQSVWAGVWWLCGVIVVGEMFDPRPRQQRIEEHEQMARER